jgi:outer membrane protein TolC
MKHISFLTIVLFVLTSIFAIAADEQIEKPPVTTFDLQGVISRTLAANPNIQAARQLVTTAEAKVNEVHTGQNIKVQGEAGYMQLAGDPSFTVVPMGTLVFGKTVNPWANVSMDWPIYTGGLIRNMIAASRQGVDASWQGYERTKQEIVAEAATAYYQVQSAQRMVEVMQKQAKTLLEAVRVSTGLYDQGIVAKLDVLRPTADLATAQAGLIQAENGYQLALNNLKRILNCPHDSEIAIAPDSSNILTVPVELPAAIKAAMEQRPEVKQLKAYMQATENQKNVILAGKNPQIGLHAQYDLKRTTLNPDFGNWSIAIMLRQSISDGGTSKAQLATTKSQRDELNIREQALRQGIQMQVSSAILNIKSAEKKVQAMTQAKNAATEGYKVAEASYKNQILPIIDVLSAQTTLTNANMQFALAEFDQQTALIQYHLAVGDLPVATKQ